MAEMGVDVLRLSPQSRHMGEVVEIFYEVVDGELSIESGLESLSKIASGEMSNGFWYGQPGMSWLPAAQS